MRDPLPRPGPRRYRAPLRPEDRLLTYLPIAQVDPDAVEQLLDRAFGRDRRGRTAYAVRGRASALPGLSFAALDSGDLVGTVQCWPVQLTGDDGSVHVLTMVGPVAVDPERQRGGLGRELVARALAAAAASGADRALTLIGDPEYYGRFFGFTAERTGSWRLPGPVERRRLLARGPAVPDLPGELGPARTLAPALDAKAVEA